MTTVNHVLTRRPERRLEKALHQLELDIARLESQRGRSNDILARMKVQRDTLENEVNYLVAVQHTREELEKFEILEVVTNSSVKPKGELKVTTPKEITDYESLNNFTKKRQVALLSVPVKEVETKSERVKDTLSQYPWAVVVKMPHTKNVFHIAVPVDFKTEAQKVALNEEWVKDKPMRAKKARERIQAIKEADKNAKYKEQTTLLEELGGDKVDPVQTPVD